MKWTETAVVLGVGLASAGLLIDPLRMLAGVGFVSLGLLLVSAAASTWAWLRGERFPLG